MIPPAGLDRRFIFTGYPVSWDPALDVQWHREGNRIQLLQLDVPSLAGDVLRVKGRYYDAEHSGYGAMVRTPSILAELDIERIAADGTVQVDLTDFLIARQQLKLGNDNRIDRPRSSGLSTGTTDNALIIRMSLTYERPGMVPGDPVETVTAEKRFGFVAPPEIPMQPQKFDPRFGYFPDTILGDWKSFGVGNIIRWRLGIRDGRQKDIVFFLDPEIPVEWRPWVKRGIEAWNIAFEAAGLGKPISAKDAPDGVDWPIFSATHSTVLWEDVSKFRQRTPNWENGSASAGWLIDMRTGEILKSDIRISAPFNFLRDEYFTRAAPLDPRASSLDFPVSLMGELIQRLLTHETGHALGLRDGNYGEFAYATESLRSSKWLHSMGFSPSAMNYSRVNYVAQPEDKIDPSDLHQRVGPADISHIKWGYGGFGLPLPEQDSFLRKVAAEQASRPWLKFVDGAGDDKQPDSFDEAVETTDPIQATSYGLRNLARTVLILDREVAGGARDEGLLRHTYDKVCVQWFNEMHHVATLIGGRISVWDTAGPRPLMGQRLVDSDVQRAAMGFLSEHAWADQKWILGSESARRFNFDRTGSRISENQRRLLGKVIDRIRFLRNDTYTGESDRYDLEEFLTDLRRALWSELVSSTVKIDRGRADLQATYLEKITSPIGPPSAFDRGVVRQNLTVLRASIDSALMRTSDAATMGHLNRMSSQVSNYLDDKKS